MRWLCESGCRPRALVHLIQGLKEPLILHQLPMFKFAEHCGEQIPLLARLAESNEYFKNACDALKANSFRTPTEVLKHSVIRPRTNRRIGYLQDFLREAEPYWLAFADQFPSLFVNLRSESLISGTPRAFGDRSKTNERSKQAKCSRLLHRQIRRRMRLDLRPLFEASNCLIKLGSFEDGHGAIITATFKKWAIIASLFLAAPQLVGLRHASPEPIMARVNPERGKSPTPFVGNPDIRLELRVNVFTDQFASHEIGMEFKPKDRDKHRD